MSDDLEALSKELDALLSAIEPDERAKLTRSMATDLRRKQVRNIAAQVNPDGSAFVPRKPREERQGALRRRVGRSRAMFAKLRQARFLKAKSSPDGLEVGFFDAFVARVARVHHFGLRDRVERQSDSPVADYPARRLVGFSDADIADMGDRLLEHIASR